VPGESDSALGSFSLYYTGTYRQWLATSQGKYHKHLVVLLFRKSFLWISQSMSAVLCFPTFPVYIGMALSDVVRRKSLSIFAFNLQRPMQMHTLYKL
jgi:hypothetical protein